MAQFSRSRLWTGVAVVALAQTAVLGWMVWNRSSLLRTGREIVAEVIPVDPRDFFRGDYVVLGYTFSNVPDVGLPEGTRKGDAVYTTLKKGEGTKWDVASVASAYPASVSPDQVVLKARVEYVYPGPEPGRLTGRLRYGIESYFVPEGTGLKIEQQVRDHKIDAVLVVSASGEVAIKGLIVDGKRVHDEPLL
jgi:uncharacterized membrane-anchored protein